MGTGMMIVMMMMMMMIDDDDDDDDECESEGEAQDEVLELPSKLLPCTC